jgi:pimeloyl-ACP methyl ester carboxylesterase
MWHTVAPILTERYTVVTPDLRGAGGSSIPTSGYDKKTMAEDIYQLVGQLGYDNILLAGYDLGSGVAYSLAAEHPSLVQKLAVMEFGLPGFGYEQLMTPSPEWHAGSNWHLGFFTVPQVAEFAFRGRERELLSWFFWHLSHVIPPFVPPILRNTCGRFPSPAPSGPALSTMPPCGPTRGTTKRMAGRSSRCRSWP